MRNLDEEILASLGHYVYALVDPRVSPPDNPNRYFYIGKGQRERCFQHAEAAIEATERPDRPNPKLEKIREILEKTKQPPPIVIIAHGLSSEQESLRLEACLIATLQTDKKGNLVRGHANHEFALTLAEIQGRYSNPIDVRELGHTVLLVNLNGKKGSMAAFPDIPQEDYAQRVLGVWPVSDQKARRIDYILGVYQQLVRVVFRIHKDAAGHSRFEKVTSGLNKKGQPIPKRRFLGERAIAMEELWGNRRIIRSIPGQSKPETLTKFPRRRGSVFLALPSAPHPPTE